MYQKAYLQDICYIYAWGQGRVLCTKKASMFQVQMFAFIIYIWYIYMH